MSDLSSVRRQPNDRGAVLLIGMMAIVAMTVVAALVVDLGLVRGDRALFSTSADAIATAGALGVSEGGGTTGCIAALGYAKEMLGAMPTGISCGAFPTQCNASTPSTSAQGAVGSISIQFTFPVPDSHPAMSPSSEGAQAISAKDGDQCGRFGVGVSGARHALFAQVIGYTSLGTGVSSVAMVGDPVGPDEIVNLLLLAPHQCPVLTVNGGGSGGGIYVDSITDPVTGEVSPGRIAIDSDGTVGCGATITTNGNHANVHARGAPGCANENPAGSGWGCGVIETVAPGGAGCVPPSCSGAAGTVLPVPVSAGAPKTRAPFDYRYNCQPSYPILGIPGCPDSATTSPYLQSLHSAVMYQGSYQSFASSPHNSAGCSLKPNDTVVMPEGNYIIDCYPLSVKGTLIFSGGNLVVEGGITVASKGSLSVNTANSDSFYNWTPGLPIDKLEHSTGAAFVYLKSGTLSRTGQGELHLHHTMVYLSAASGLNVTGGSGGSMTWTAPTEGPLKDLALWTDSASTHSLGGSSHFEMTGVVFAPYAHTKLHGNGGISTAQAQIVSNTLAVSGNGAIHLSPIKGRSVGHPTQNDTKLIR